MSNSIQAHLKTEVTATFIINALLNGGIAWALLHGKSMLTLQGEEGIAVDLVITAFLLCLLLSWITIALQRRKVSSGQFPEVPAERFSALRKVIRYLPDRPFGAALCIGLAGTLVYAAPTITLLSLLGIEQLSVSHYLIFKTLWTGLIAALTCPLAVLFPLFKQQAGSAPAPLVSDAGA
ncbi:MAG: hypothetical protein VW877_08150 [Pseudomonadaceae bacterium]